MTAVFRAQLCSPIVVLLCAGCLFTYHSEYRPPADGRARAVWRDNQIEMLTPGAELSKNCLSDMVRKIVFSELKNEEAFYGNNKARIDANIIYQISCPRSRCNASGYWIPSYIYTKNTITQDDWHFHQRQTWKFRFAPKFTTGLAVNLEDFWQPAEPDAPFNQDRRALFVGYVSLVWPVVADAAALIVSAFLPPIGLMWANPSLAEPADSSRGAVDQVNVYNDLARTPGSSCAYEEAVEAP